jgi:hypothetical protein
LNRSQIINVSHCAQRISEGFDLELGPGENMGTPRIRFFVAQKEDECLFTNGIALRAVDPRGRVVASTAERSDSNCRGTVGVVITETFPYLGDLKGYGTFVAAIVLVRPHRSYRAHDNGLGLDGHLLNGWRNDGGCRRCTPESQRHE